MFISERLYYIKSHQSTFHNKSASGNRDKNKSEKTINTLVKLRDCLQKWLDKEKKHSINRNIFSDNHFLNPSIQSSLITVLSAIFKEQRMKL